MKQILNISLTTINLCILSAIIAYAVSTLGDDEPRFREHLLFRDGSTTVTGTLRAESGAWYLTQDGTLFIKFIKWDPVTEYTTHAQLLSVIGEDGQCLWRPGGSEISSASAEIRHQDQMWDLTTTDYVVRNPDYEYDFAVRDGENLLLSRAVW